MASTIKKPEELEILREAGRRLGAILRECAAAVKPGVTLLELDALCEARIREGGDEPAFKNYKPTGAARAFPATLCVSVNDAVVHGIPTDYALKESDIVGLDLGLVHKGLYVDAAVTVGVGTIDPEAQRLIDCAREALSVGIKEARGGGRTGDIGEAIETVVDRYGYGTPRELAGHGVGYAAHEEPFVPNYGKWGTGAPLKAGMVIAIEPMVNEGGDEILLASDRFTYKTRDGKRSAHFEHTIIITDGDPEIITK